jgi:hypothetical protein
MSKRGHERKLMSDNGTPVPRWKRGTLLHIYDDPNERWLVELRVSYAEQTEALGNDGLIDTPAKAAAAALALTTDDGAGGTLWVVTDRRTGRIYQLEQRTFA